MHSVIYEYNFSTNKEIKKTLISTAVDCIDVSQIIIILITMLYNHIPKSI